MIVRIINITLNIKRELRHFLCGGALLVTLFFVGATGGQLVAQETDNFDNFNNLFDDIPATQNDSVASQNADGIQNTDANNLQTNSLFSDILPKQIFEVFGKHQIFMPIPLNPDYFDYKESPRSPRVFNMLGIAYQAEHIDIHAEFTSDFYASALPNITDGSSTANSIDYLDAFSFGIGETYITYYNKFLNWSTGLKIYSWGSGIGINPTDQLNPRDARPGFFSKKLPVLSTSLSVYPTRIFSIEAILIPLYIQDIYPVNTLASLQQTLNASLQNADLIAIGLPAQFANNITSKTASVHVANPANDIWQAQIGVKANFYFSFGDLSLSYIYDVDDYYSFDSVSLSLDSPTNPTAFNTIYNLTRNRLHRFGLDFITTQGRYTTWLEFSADLAQDINAANYSKIRNHQINFNLGLETKFGKDDFISLVEQLFGTYIIDYPSNLETDSTKTEDVYTLFNYTLAQQLEEFRWGLLVDLSFKLFDERFKPALRTVMFAPMNYWQASTAGSNDSRLLSMLVSPSFEIIPIDALSITIASEIAYAWIRQNDEIITNQEDPIGALVRYNKISLELTYSWAKRF